MKELPERRSIRLLFYDHAAAGAYFVTINTHKKLPTFCKLRGGEVELNRTRRIADEKWLQLPEHFPQVSLDAYIVIPTHMHGILFILDQDEVDATQHVRAQHAAPLHKLWSGYKRSSSDVRRAPLNLSRHRVAAT